MMGMAIKPMEITEAATTPVVAANKAPTNTTAIPTPPRRGPKTCPTVSSKSSAMRLRSRMMPIKVKKGMAKSVSFCMMPKTRKGKAWNRLEGNKPSSIPMKPKNKPVAAKENATGKPTNKNTSKPVNMMGTKLLVTNSIMMRLLPDGLFLVRQCPGPAAQLHWAHCGPGRRGPHPSKRPLA